jgi:hypothetical protein
MLEVRPRCPDCAQKELDTLPPEIVAKLLSFGRVVEGEAELGDREGAMKFISANLAQYPALFSLVQLPVESLVKLYEDSGEVPPGVKLVKRIDFLGTNLTKVEVLHGPIPPKAKDEEENG